MYAAFEDPYCYPGTSVLKNKLHLRDAARLSAFEEEITKARAGEPLPNGRLSVSHYLAVHRHLFQDVYDWAGRVRTVRISKGGSTFAYPEHLKFGLRRLFGNLRADDYLRGLSTSQFALSATHFIAELNALHPFRDGNGRVQLSFLALIARGADHPLVLERLRPDRFLQAMIASFQGDETHLAAEIHDLVVSR